jgi:hypothetical protein
LRKTMKNHGQDTWPWASFESETSRILMRWVTHSILMLTMNKKLCINSEHKLLYYSQYYSLPCLHQFYTQEIYSRRVYIIEYA